MTANNSNDPADIFRDWVSQWERAVDSFSNEMMGTDEFSKAMNKAQDSQLKFQKIFGEMMAAHLANLNMPSRKDIEHISDGIRELDNRMARMEAKLTQLLSASNQTTASKRGPPRTKKSPAKKSPAKK